MTRVPAILASILLALGTVFLARELAILDIQGGRAVTSKVLSRQALAVLFHIDAD